MPNGGSHIEVAISRRQRAWRAAGSRRALVCPWGSAINGVAQHAGAVGGGGMTGVAGKAAKMFKYMGDDISEQLGNIFKPSEWDRVYAENPGLANEIQRGATRFYRNHLSIGDRVFGNCWIRVTPIR